MSKKILISLSTLILTCTVLCQNVFSWDNEISHRDLSSIASKNSVLSESRSNYLRNLGIRDGLDETFKWGLVTKTAEQWIQEGAFLEDEGTYRDAINGRARYNNHFHNPLKPWSAAGLSDLQSGESTVFWGQDSWNQSVSTGGEWSWHKVRLCYYYALTARTEDDRQAFFACTFEGLGYQMHLIQDMAVPAHVRNDAHPLDALLGGLKIDRYLESWAMKNYIKVNSFALSPTFPEVSLDVSRNGLVPTTQFIDSEQYNGSIPSTSLTWGLAEYTNSNFVSDDTIFTEDNDVDDNHYFPYPRYSAVSYKMYEVPNSLITKRIYLKKEGDGEHIEHFATAGPLLKWLSFDPVLQKSEFKLDRLVYRDYVQKLIPRAVGYSAALIDYFFRGRVEAVDAEALNDLSDNIAGAKLKVKNSTPDEVMGSGSFEIAYQYKSPEGGDSVHGLSNEVGLLEDVPADSISESALTFLFYHPIPRGAQEVKYFLVYRGRLGSEENAVVGRLIHLGRPRGAIIRPISGSWTDVVISIIDDNKVRSYYAGVPSGESVVKAAFDEGNVDIVRILSQKRTEEMTVWQLHTFSFDADTDLYVELSVEELYRVIPLPPIKTGFSYSFDNKDPSCSSSHTWSGNVQEDYAYSLPVIDFFISRNGQAHYLKREVKTYTLHLPFIDKYDWQYTCVSNCSKSYAESERYVSGTVDEPDCTRKGTSTDCDGSKSWDYEGLCYADDVWAVDIGLWEFEACDGSYSAWERLSIWLYDILDYDGTIKKIVNSKYDGTSPGWENKPAGRPCLLMENDARRESGQLSGRILSDRQVIVDSTEDSPVIEPGGESLNVMPQMVLRQSNGYSILEIGKEGVFRNQTSIMSVASDKPLLLNKEGNGFKVGYDNAMSKAVLRMGFNYDDKIQDFQTTGSLAFFVDPSTTMDVMVEYVNNDR